MYTRGGDTIEATLEGAPVEVLDNNDGTYQLLISPNLADEYQLFVKIHGAGERKRETVSVYWQSECNVHA